MGKGKALKKLLLIFICICIGILYLIPTPQGYSFIYASQSRPIQNHTNIKYILYWNDFWGFTSMPLGLGTDPFKNCPVKNCLMTMDRSLIPMEQFVAIVFHTPSLPYYSLLNLFENKPFIRSIHQKYIFYSLEPPTMYRPDYKYSKHFFNWTMSYRTDSDIFNPYSFIIKRKTDYVKPSPKQIRNKTKMVAWFVSNCNRKTTKVRTKYVEELKKYLSVDIYGKCGTLNCPFTEDQHCYKMLEQNYKYYLSFENSICKDYVTEKLYNILRYNVIPVVLGGANYTTLAPPNSYIDVQNFESPKDLAEYLLKLSNNIEEYLKYFDWKSDYVIEPSNERTVCQLCQKLHEPLTYSTYDLKMWFEGPNNSYCRVAL